MKCHRNTVKRWLDQWEETKDLSECFRVGPPRSTTADEDQLMVDLTTEKMDATSETVKQELEKTKVFISNRTIRRRFHEAGLQYMRPLSKPLLNKQHRQRRVRWAREMKNYDWNLVMVIDETMIRLHTSRKFSWQRPGERRIARTVKFSLKVNVWGCFSEQGFRRICCFTRDLNSKFLCNHIYRNVLLPFARYHFARSPWFLLEDNDPKHRSNYTSAWKSAHRTVRLPWPSMSPDMNPIENLWSILKTKVTYRRPHTIKDLIIAINKEWNNLPKELELRLINSMKNRIEGLIDASGDHSMY